MNPVTPKPSPAPQTDKPVATTPQLQKTLDKMPAPAAREKTTVPVPAPKR